MDAASKFLIDECLSPALAEIAKGEFGYQAIHVPWLGKPPHGHRSWQDPDIVDKLIASDYILVTNNRKDFVGKYFRDRNAEVHNGLVVILQKSDFVGEAAAFRQVLNFLASLDDTVNKLVEIDASGDIRVADWPKLDSQMPWADPFR